MKKILTSLVVFSLLFLVVTPVLAFPSLIPEECAGDAELDPKKCKPCPLEQEDRKGCCCDLSSVERTAVNVSQIILGVTGSVVLLVFVLGGILYMTSGGAAEKVKKATTMIKTAVIGLAIILLAGIIIQTILLKLTQG